LASNQRTSHILLGNATGGGHLIAAGGVAAVAAKKALDAAFRTKGIDDSAAYAKWWDDQAKPKSLN